jgi:phosphate transport system substrate-binding protein
MGNLKPMTPPTEWRAGSMGGLIELVSLYDNSVDAIGYSVFYYASEMYGNDKLRMLAVNGVTPSYETILNGRYRFSDYYYAVLRADTPQDDEVRGVVAWLLSDEGQRAATAVNYVPLRAVVP